MLLYSYFVFPAPPPPHQQVNFLYLLVTGVLLLAAIMGVLIAQVGVLAIQST